MPHSPNISFQRGEILLIGFAHISAAFFSVRTAIPGRSLRTARVAMRAGRTASAVAADALPLCFLVYQISKHACDGYADNNYRYNFKRSHNMPLLICFLRYCFPSVHALFFLRNAGSFILPLFLRITSAANTAATASQMKSVHHHESTV